VNIIPAAFLIPALLVVVPAYADVWIPENEFTGYFNSGGIYTVAGAVKNTEPYPVSPTVIIDVFEGDKTVSVSQTLPTIFPNKDIPFRIHMHQITSSEVILQNPRISYEKVITESTPDVQVIYDRTLVKHDDGHLTGRIINNGTQTEYDLKVYALIHGQDHEVLDVGINFEKIEKIEPGQTVEFTLYPDPKFTDMVSYYSCFAIGDETIVPMYATRDGERYDFRYDSTASFIVAGFDDSGTELSIYGINSFKIPTYVNFEFPMASSQEKFDVTVNGEPIEFIQSIDEMNNWHVAFDVEGSSQNDIVIRGFATTPDADALPQVSDGDAEYSVLPYAVAVVAAAGVGIYLLKRKKKVTA